MSSFIQGAGPLPGTPCARARRERAIVFPSQRGLREDSPPPPTPARSSPGTLQLTWQGAPSPRVSRGPATPATHRRGGRGDWPLTHGPRRVSRGPHAAPPGSALPNPTPRPPPSPVQALAPPPRGRGSRQISAPDRPPQRRRGRLRHRPEKGLEPSRNPASPGTTTPGMPPPRADYISQKAAWRAPGDALSLQLRAHGTRCACPHPTHPPPREVRDSAKVR